MQKIQRNQNRPIGLTPIGWVRCMYGISTLSRRKSTLTQILNDWPYWDAEWIEPEPKWIDGECPAAERPFAWWLAEFCFHHDMRNPHPMLISRYFIIWLREVRKDPRGAAYDPWVTSDKIRAGLDLVSACKLTSWRDPRRKPKRPAYLQL